MYKLFYCLIIAQMFCSCNSTSQNTKKEIVKQNEVDSLPNIQETIHRETKLYPINIDFKYYISALKIVKDTISDYNKFKLREFTYLKSGQNQFKYYILSELKFNNIFKSYLIAGDYESEQSCWIANYSSNNQLLSSYEVYYDNAEGAWSITSIIDQAEKIIKIKTYDAYRNPEEKIDSLRIDNQGKFIVIASK